MQDKSKKFLFFTVSGGIFSLVFVVCRYTGRRSERDSLIFIQKDLIKILCRVTHKFSCSTFNTRFVAFLFRM